jgi:hypothetical protein
LTASVSCVPAATLAIWRSAPRHRPTRVRTIGDRIRTERDAVVFQRDAVVAEGRGVGAERERIGADRHAVDAVRVGVRTEGRRVIAERLAAVAEGRRRRTWPGCCADAMAFSHACAFAPKAIALSAMASACEPNAMALLVSPPLRLSTMD